MAMGKHKRRKPRGEIPEAEHWGGPIRSSDEACNGAGAKGSGQVVVWSKQLETGRCRYIRQTKPFKIYKEASVRAYKAVKSNAGSAGVDGQTIEQFDSDLQNNLYKALEPAPELGSYFPPPVAPSPFQKRLRPADFRCAHRSGSRGPDGCQQLIEPDLDPIFLADSLWLSAEKIGARMLSALRASGAGNTTGF